MPTTSRGWISSRRYDAPAFTAIMSPSITRRRSAWRRRPASFSPPSRAHHATAFRPDGLSLPLYHPLRMVEEICMLDQMSGGRLEIGFGRGASPIELRCSAKTRTMRRRSIQRGAGADPQGLTGKSADLPRRAPSTFDDVPIVMEPFQKPYPPIWYGVHSPDTAARAARRGLNTSASTPTD